MNIEKYFEDFNIMDWTSQPSPGGGISWELVDGATFRAGISMMSSAEIVVAESQGMKSQFRITSKKLLFLEKDDVVRRLKDQKLYRITTNQIDNENPEISVVQFSTCRAERVD